MKKILIVLALLVILVSGCSATDNKGVTTTSTSDSIDVNTDDVDSLDKDLYTSDTDSLDSDLDFNL